MTIGDLKYGDLKTLPGSYCIKIKTAISLKSAPIGGGRRRQELQQQTGRRLVVVVEKT